MSKRFDTSGMYPGKRNPGGSPTTGRTNNTPQGKAGETPCAETGSFTERSAVCFRRWRCRPSAMSAAA